MSSPSPALLGVPGQCAHGRDPGSCPLCLAGVGTVVREQVLDPAVEVVDLARWYYLDLADLAKPEIKHPYAVPFNVREPRAFGMGISDSSMRRLIVDENPV